jgi:hypothetical protein
LAEIFWRVARALRPTCGSTAALVAASCARDCASRASKIARVGLLPSAVSASALSCASPKRCHHGPFGAPSSGRLSRHGASTFQVTGSSTSGLR